MAFFNVHTIHMRSKVYCRNVYYTELNLIAKRRMALVDFLLWFRSGEADRLCVRACMSWRGSSMSLAALFVLLLLLHSGFARFVFPKQRDRIYSKFIISLIIPPICPLMTAQYPSSMPCFGNSGSSP